MKWATTNKCNDPARPATLVWKVAANVSVASNVKWLAYVDSNLIYNHKTFDKLINKIRVTFVLNNRKKTIWFTWPWIKWKSWLQTVFLARSLASDQIQGARFKGPDSSAKINASRCFSWNKIEFRIQVNFLECSHQMRLIDLPVLILFVPNQKPIYYSAQLSCHFIAGNLKEKPKWMSHRKQGNRNFDQAAKQTEADSKRRKYRFKIYTHRIGEHRHRTALCLPRFLSIMLYSVCIIFTVR